MEYSVNDYVALCMETARRLALANPEGAVNGEQFFLDEVPCELAFSELRGSAFLSCEVGDPQPHVETEVYRQLVEMQLILFQLHDCTFGRDPLNDRLLFCVRFGLHAGATAEALAQTITKVAGLVRQWQLGMLDGKLIDYEAEFDKVAAAMNPGEPARAGMAA